MGRCAKTLVAPMLTLSRGSQVTLLEESTGLLAVQINRRIISSNRIALLLTKTAQAARGQF